jgi:N6-L-threonylcarbamoyladenine synthase
MLILGIETSCDETSASVVKDGREILSNKILSQVDIHKKFGGVVPEIASRQHVEAIIPTIQDALREAKVSLDDIDAVGVTNGPGLIGALMVGLSTAKGICLAKNIPLIGVNHIEAHLYANYMQFDDLDFPFVGLIVSGGHTSLVYVEDIGNYEILGKTVDDAAGESFDKTAKLLGLEYPGGPVIDELSKNGDVNFVKFPRPCINDNTFNFSFSGLKTAVLYYVKSMMQKPSKPGGLEQSVIPKNVGIHEKKNNKAEVIAKAAKQSCLFDSQVTANICASFQEAVVDVLVKKTFKAAKYKNVKNIVVGGGVSLNSRLRERFKQEAEKNNIKVFFPKPDLCIDNAAMIAGLAYQKFQNNNISGLDLDADSCLSFQNWKDKL